MSDAGAPNLTSDGASGCPWCGDSDPFGDHDQRACSEMLDDPVGEDAYFRG